MKWKSKGTGGTGYTEYTNFDDKQAACDKAEMLDRCDLGFTHYVQEQSSPGEITNEYWPRKVGGKIIWSE